MSDIVHIMVDGTDLALVLDGRSFSVNNEHPNFKKICELLKEESVTASQLLEYVDATVPVQRVLGAMDMSDVRIEYGTVYFKDRPIHNALTQKILRFHELGLPTEPLVKFFGRLMNNPSKRSVDQLPNFLETKKIALSVDGCFLAYKAVRSDLLDKHSGTIVNSIGQYVSMDRNQVDDDPDSACSTGLHVGNLDYIKWYAQPGDKVLLVKVDPADAVSVPKDHSFGKLRTCGYTVVAIYKDLASVNPHDLEELEDGVYTDSGEKFDHEIDYNEDEDLDDYDSDYDYYDDLERYEFESMPDEPPGGYRGADFDGEVPAPTDEDNAGYEDELDIESKEDWIDRVMTDYNTSYDRDNLCRLAAERGIFASTEEARRAGKNAVAHRLAEDDYSNV